MKKKGGLLWIPGTEGISLKDAVKEVRNNPEIKGALTTYAKNEADSMQQSQPQKITLPSEAELEAMLKQGGRRKTKTLRRKFDKCVRAVRKTVKARRGSTKKQAAYAICTKSILKEHGRT